MTITISPWLAGHLLRLINAEAVLIEKVPGQDAELDRLAEELAELNEELENVVETDEPTVVEVDDDNSDIEEDLLYEPDGAWNNWGHEDDEEEEEESDD